MKKSKEALASQSREAFLREKLKLDFSFDYGVDFDNRVVRMSGYIGDILEDFESVTFDKVDAALTRMENDSSEPITIRLNSGGGSVYEGLAIVGRLTSSPCEIIVEAYGCCMSAATLILACGDHRRISKYTISMFHQSAYGVSGSHEEVKEQVEQQEKEEKLWAKWVAELSKKTEKFWYKTVKKKNVYLTAEKMFAYGVVDEII